MNTKTPAQTPDAGQYRSLQILDELSHNDALTQRDLSSRLGIALGLVNSYVKNLVAKGYITVRAIPPKRYAYYLTPKGFTEKTRLAYDLLQDYTRIYREAKSNYRKLFQELEQAGVKRVVFAGADEVAEFAYITLQETSLELAGIVDDEKAGESFIGRRIVPLAEAKTIAHDCIIITSYLRQAALYAFFVKQGFNESGIRKGFPGGRASHGNNVRSETAR
ncbi:MAG: winged helix-turn-helix transcriptional regulator [Nitrospiraceae bacterium]|nr:winged helix-turn-helix transcriptional regulator [Nitrospiraceae bacterium]